MRREITLQDVAEGCQRAAQVWAGKGITGVYGVPRGGVPPASQLAHLLGVQVLQEPEPGCLVFDDICDSGATLERYEAAGFPTDALFRRPGMERLAPNAAEVDEWLVFPWEADEGRPTDAVTRLLQYLGEDVTRDGLVDTPRRVVAALEELTAGYRENPAEILARTFDVEHDQMIHVHNITVKSLCEHHMLPFIGTAHVAYIPGERVVGLSKIPRLVHTFARRLQVQERLTDEIADALAQHVGAKGVGVQITAHHLCMGLRGVGEPDATMTTTALRGVFWEPTVRQEFLA